MLVEVLPDLERDPVAELEAAHHLRAPQVEHPVAQPQLLRGVDAILDHERRYLRSGDELELLGQHLDLTGRHLGVEVGGRTRRHGTDDADHILGPEPLGRIAHGVGAQHLHPPRTIPQIYEDNPAQVTPPTHPSHQLHSPADIGGPQAPTKRSLERTHARRPPRLAAVRGLYPPPARPFPKAMWSRTRTPPRCWSDAGCDRQREGKRRAFATLARDPDAATVQLDDLLGDGEPQTGGGLTGRWLG